MVTSCCAFGCTYRHKKGNKIGTYRFPKDEDLCNLWIIAMRRLNWKPTPSSRICGQHFQTGKPSKDKNHPDYVPNIFVFNQNSKSIEEKRKIVQENTSQKADKRLIKPAVQFYPFSTSSGNMKENDNIGKKKVNEVLHNNSFLLPKEIRPSLPQRVWLLNFIPAKVNSDISAKNETAPFVNESYSTSTSESTVVYEGNTPIYIKSEVTITDDDDDDNGDTISVRSDDSTLSARSSMSTTEYATSLNFEPCMTASKKFSRNVKSSISSSNLFMSDIGNVESSVPDNESSVVYNTESSVTASENSSSLNVDAMEYSSENVTEDTTDNMLTPTLKPVKEMPDYDYSNFMWSHNDSKEVLAIKLETMLAVNMSLKEKVKFYQNRCKLYEKEINNLRKHNKQGPTVVKLENPLV